MEIQRGYRDKIEKFADDKSKITVTTRVDGGSVYDFCCFGVDANGKLSELVERNKKERDGIIHSFYEE